MTNNQSDHDLDSELKGYESDDYVTAAGSFNWCQWNNDQDDRGLMLTEINYEAVSFDIALAVDHNWTIIEKDFNDSTGQSTTCIVNPEPILTVVRRGKLRMYQKPDDGGKHIDVYNPMKYDSVKHVLKTRYLVFLLAASSGGYTLLHDVPLQLSLKGVPGAQFGTRGGPLDILDQAVSRFYGKKVPKFAFAINLLTKSEKMGEKQKSWVCSIIKPAMIRDKQELNSYYVGKNILDHLVLVHDATNEFDQIIVQEEELAAVASDDEWFEEDEDDNANEDTNWIHPKTRTMYNRIALDSASSSQIDRSGADVKKLRETLKTMFNVYTRDKLSIQDYGKFLLYLEALPNKATVKI